MVTKLVILQIISFLFAFTITALAQTTAKPQSEKYDFQTVVKGIERLYREGTGIGRFDPNRYFEVFKHLSMEKGYLLDYAYVTVGPNIIHRYYLYFKLLLPYPTFRPVELLRDCEEIKKKTKECLAFIKADGSYESFFEFVILNEYCILNEIARWGYLYRRINEGALWDKLRGCGFYASKVVTTQKDIQEIISNKFDLERKQRVREVKPQPIIRFEDENSVTVSIILFSIYGGGFLRKVYNIRRTFPHKIESVETFRLVPHGFLVD